MTGDVGVEELVDSFGQSVGVEKARDIVTSTAAELGLDSGERFSRAAVIDLCEAIQQDHTGYIALVAHELQVRTQAERRFDALLENIPDPAIVVRYDRETGEPLVQSVNSAFESVFGYEESDVLGTNINDLIVPDGAESEATTIDAEHARGNRVEREVQRLTATGDARDFLFRAVPIETETGEIEGYGVYTDITEQKRRERELERKNEQLERFTSVVSHDLRNPLNVAHGRLELAMAETDNPHLPTVMEVLERMEQLVDDLLALARQGLTVGDLHPTSFEESGVRAWSSVAAPEASVTCRREGTILADPERLVALLENLFRNAVTHGGADVTIHTGLTEDGFYVEDDGPGIDPDEHELVFEHGYTTDDDGTGFGLSIVRSIADAHGWSVRVTDSETGGARFEVSGVEFA